MTNGQVKAKAVANIVLMSIFIVVVVGAILIAGFAFLRLSVFTPGLAIVIALGVIIWQLRKRKR